MSQLQESDKTEKQKKKENAQAQCAILQFLRELNIRKIVYVDDRCSIQELKEAFKGKLKSHHSQKPEELDFIDWELPFPIFEKAINSLWDEANEEKKRELFLNLLEFEGNKEELENSIAPLKLKEYLKEKIELYSPVDWVVNENKILADLGEESKILFLFDIEFDHAPLEDGRNGKQLAVELLSRNEINEYIYCGIFSHLFSIEQEYEKRNEYCNNDQLPKEKFYTISKQRFQEDSYLPGLAEGIRNTLLINEVEYLKTKSSKIIKKAFKASLSELENLSPESFNHIIQRSSKKDGIWEMATLIRVNNIISNDKALNSLLSKSKRKNINERVDKIRKVEKIKTGGETHFEKTQIQNLREKELYIDGEILNELHFPISNGDIFRIGDKKYILLGQPCNLALRNKGRRELRGGKNFETGFLLEIESVSKEDFEKINGGVLSTIGMIEQTTIPLENYSVVRFQMFQTISLSPLDLTVYNNDGVAQIDLDVLNHTSEIIQDSWKLRYKALHKEFTVYKENIRIFNKLRSTDKEKLKSLVLYGELFKGYNLCNEQILDTSQNKITLDIKRISHYKEPFSSDVLQQFMQYLSRNAFERNFLND